MKILYLGNFNPFAKSTEKLIKKSLEELGHTVYIVDERDVNPGRVLAEALNYNVDLFLFHKGTRWGLPLEQLMELLFRLPCKIAFWYFDPITGIPEREMFMEAVIPYVDLAFMTNGSWIRQHNYENTRWLLQGCDVKPKGKFRKEYECDIAFTGQVYGNRDLFIEGLKKKYGDRFKVFNNVFGEDFYDLCQSAKILVSPKFPSDDYFWSNRIYMTLGAGGFLIHPYCKGLEDEFVAGEHYEDYRTQEELYTKIDYYLEHDKERKKIANAGYDKTIKDFSYTERVKKLISEIEKI
jgi:hypothetical protein